MWILGLPRSRTNPASVPPWCPRTSRLRPTGSGRSGGRRGPSSSAPMRAPGSAARPSDRRRHIATARRRYAAGRAPGKSAADARHRPRPAGPNASSSTHSSGPPRGASKCPSEPVLSLAQASTRCTSSATGERSERTDTRPTPRVATGQSPHLTIGRSTCVGPRIPRAAAHGRAPCSAGSSGPQSRPNGPHLGPR